MADLELNTELARTIIAHERINFVAWASAIRDVQGNPYGGQVQQFGKATVILNRQFNAAIFNRVFEITYEDRHHVPAILDLFRENGVRPMFDISPYGIAPYSAGDNILRVLAKHGLYHGGFHQMIYARPTADVPATPAHIQISEVTAPDSEDGVDFVRIHEWYAGAGNGRAIQLLIGHPEYTCYLARIDGQAAAIGLLHVNSGVGSMATGITHADFRNRGCQTALLWRRLADAAQKGCHMMVSQCQPGSSSQNNQLRAGFKIAGTKVWWTTPE